jgi:hypothetical protein
MTEEDVSLGDVCSGGIQDRRTSVSVQERIRRSPSQFLGGLPENKCTRRVVYVSYSR